MGKNKVRSRVVLVIVLTVLLVMLTIVSSTYSWFNRPNNLTGNALSYNPTVNCYDGAGVTVSTKRSATGEDSYPYTDLLSSSHSLDAGARDYYRTTLQNSTTTDQYVSLYLSGLKTTSTTGELCVGVNSPVKSYKNFSLRENASSSSSSTSSITTMRLYFEPKNDANFQGGNYWISYTTGSTALNVNNDSHTVDGTPAQFIYTGTQGYFYVDVPTNMNEFIIMQHDWTHSYEHTKKLSRTDIGISATQSKVVYLVDGKAYTTFNEADPEWADVSGANVINWFNAISIRNGDSLPISLAGGTDYIGNVTYTSSDESKLRIYNNRLYGVGVGSPTLTMTVTGPSYGDTITKTCTVNVTSTSSTTFTKEDAPILQNIKVPAKSETVVDWFIMNDKDANGSVTFEFSSLYVGV